MFILHLYIYVKILNSMAFLHVFLCVKTFKIFKKMKILIFVGIKSYRICFSPQTNFEHVKKVFYITETCSNRYEDASN